MDNFNITTRDPPVSPVAPLSEVRPGARLRLPILPRRKCSASRSANQTVVGLQTGREFSYATTASS